MPDIIRMLRAQDLGYLQIVAGAWGLDEKPNDMDLGAESVAAAMLDADLAEEILAALQPAARAAWDALAKEGGRMPWAAFARQFGDVREMGAGRRDREQPHVKPASAAEVLFYRALLGRAFFDTDKGPQEFAYIPDDLLQLVRKREPGGVQARTPLGRAAMPAEHAEVRRASDHILDEATTLLAALRIGEPAPDDAVLRGLLECAGLLQRGIPQASKVRTFLEMPRAAALQMLVDSWRASDTFDELRVLPGLVCEGTWSNRPRQARQFILDQLEAIPATAWWSLRGFVDGVQAKHADFQRPAGDYDSWFIKRASDGTYLRGFSSWDEVDGALLRFTITEVMHRLGLVDLAGGDQPPGAFRRVENLAGGKPPTEDGRLHVGSHGRITAPRSVPRAIRYQLARFCEWEEQVADEFRYRISPRALERAAKQGLKVEHLLNLLGKHSRTGVPAAIVKALKRWEEAGTEARAEPQTILRVRRPEIITALRKSKAAKYLGEPLGPTTIIVKAGAIRKVAEAMAELGLLLEDTTGS